MSSGSPPRLHVVFDLDGTLIDSVRDLAASASELVTSLGGAPLDHDQVALMVGDGAALLVRRALSAAGLDPTTPGALERFLDIYDRRLLETTRPYPGVDDMLLMASRRARLSVLTNKPTRHTRRILDALELTHWFDGIIGGDGPLGRKPDPTAFRSITSGAAHAVMVGDSPIDWRTAEAAGATFVWARYGFGALRFENGVPDTPYIIDSPPELAAVLDRVEALAQGA